MSDYHSTFPDDIEQERYCDQAAYWIDHGNYVLALNFCDKALNCSSQRWNDYANQLKAEALRKKKSYENAISQKNEDVSPEQKKLNYCAYCGSQITSFSSKHRDKLWCGCEIKEADHSPFLYYCGYCGGGGYGYPKNINNQKYWCGCKKGLKEVTKNATSEINVKTDLDESEVKPRIKSFLDKIFKGNKEKKQSTSDQSTLDITNNKSNNKLVNNKCYIHKNRPATGICNQCGKPVCYQCFVTSGSEIYCNSCFNEIKGKEYTRKDDKISGYGKKALKCHMCLNDVSAKDKYCPRCGTTLKNSYNSDSNMEPVETQVNNDDLFYSYKSVREKWSSDKSLKCAYCGKQPLLKTEDVIPTGMSLLDIEMGSYDKRFWNVREIEWKGEQLSAKQLYDIILNTINDRAGICPKCQTFICVECREKNGIQIGNKKGCPFCGTILKSF